MHELSSSFSITLQEEASSALHCCLLYYRRPTCHCVCHFCSGLSATAIKEYCIVLW